MAERRAVHAVRQRRRHRELHRAAATSPAVGRLERRLAVERFPQRETASSLGTGDHPPRIFREHRASGIRDGVAAEVVVVIVADEDQRGARRVG